MPIGGGFGIVAAGVVRRLWVSPIMHHTICDRRSLIFIVCVLVCLIWIAFTKLAGASRAGFTTCVKCCAMCSVWMRSAVIDRFASQMNNLISTFPYICSTTLLVFFFAFRIIIAWVNNAFVIFGCVCFLFGVIVFVFVSRHEYQGFFASNRWRRWFVECGIIDECHLNRLHWKPILLLKYQYSSIFYVYALAARRMCVLYLSLYAPCSHFGPLISNSAQTSFIN